MSLRPTASLHAGWAYNCDEQKGHRRDGFNLEEELVFSMTRGTWADLLEGKRHGTCSLIEAIVNRRFTVDEPDRPVLLEASGVDGFPKSEAASLKQIQTSLVRSP